MKKRMESLDGAIANLGDSWDAFFYQIGQSGATDVLKDSFNAVGDALNEVNAMLSSGEMQGYIEAIGISFSGWTDSVQSATEAMTQIIEQWGGDNQDAIGELTEFFKNAFLELPQNIKAFVQLASVEFAALVVDVEIYGRKIANFLNPMSPTYNLKENLDASVKVYQESIEAILAEREKVTKQASERKDKAKMTALDNLLGDWK